MIDILMALLIVLLIGVMIIGTMLNNLRNMDGACSRNSKKFLGIWKYNDLHEFYVEYIRTDTLLPDDFKVGTRCKHCQGLKERIWTSLDLGEYLTLEGLKRVEQLPSNRFKSLDKREIKYYIEPEERREK